MDLCDLLTHCGLVTLYGNIDLGQHWYRQWLVAWRLQAITWTNVDLSSAKFSGIHLWAMPELLFCITSFKSIHSKLLPHLQGTNELIHITQSSFIGWHMVTQIWVNIGSGNGLLPDGTKPLPEPMLTYHQRSSLAFTFEQCPSYYSV